MEITENYRLSSAILGRYVEMVFSSSIFLFLFLPIVLFVYYLCHDRVKNGWLLLASLFFYSWGEPKHIFLMLGSIVVNYFLGIEIEKVPKKYKRRKVLLIFTCIIDIGLLIIFKYLDFGIHTINALFHTNLLLKGLALPIGISFYTFQVMSYVIDVYRGTVKAQRNILNLGLYISLFPQLIAGPIVRYVDVKDQLTKRGYGIEYLYLGAKRFMLGFSKKVLIADNLSVLADLAFNTSISSMPLAWIGIFSYSLQIYYDFSGYSDMAIGLGKMFGFDFMENFNYPYSSCSIQEFWRRWHISLGSWFRDYIYIPLGGSRGKKYQTYLNTFIVFLLTGLWHGASWNFVLWGIYYAIFLILERMFLKNLLLKIPIYFRHLYTILIVLFGWVLFRSEGLLNAVGYIKIMFCFRANWSEIVLNLSLEYLVYIIIGIIGCTPFFDKIKKVISKEEFLDLFIFVFFIIAILTMVSRGFSPFLYFRF